MSTQETTQSRYSDATLLRAAEIYSTAESRGVLPIGKSTFYGWLRSGKIKPGRKIAGTRLFAYKEIKALAEDPEIQAQ